MLSFRGSVTLLLQSLAIRANFSIMPNSKPPRLQLVLSGNGVSYQTLPAGELGALIIDLEQAILQTGQQHSDQAAGVVSLSEIGPGSAKLSLALQGSALLGATLVAVAVANAKFDELPTGAHAALYNIFRRLVSHSWSLAWKPSKTLQVPPAVISRENPIPAAPAPRDVRGTSTVYGRLVRVGGESPKAQVKLDSGLMLFVDLDESQACELGHRLYQEIGLQGEAVWNGETLEMTSFSVRRVLTYRRSDVVHAFEQLAAAAGRRWEGVNAAKYVRSLRSAGRK